MLNQINVGLGNVIWELTTIKNFSNTSDDDPLWVQYSHWLISSSTKGIPGIYLAHHTTPETTLLYPWTTNIDKKHLILRYHHNWFGCTFHSNIKGYTRSSCSNQMRETTILKNTKLTSGTVVILMTWPPHWRNIKLSALLLNRGPSIDTTVPVII